jgi:hypothetical protein
MKLHTIILLIVIFGIIVFCVNCDTTEHYINYGYRRYKYCKSCGEKSRGSCNNCVNCGYCLTPAGHGQCVSGDENGPYFREDCVDYEYNNPIFSYFSSWYHRIWGKNRYLYNSNYYNPSYRRYINNRSKFRKRNKYRNGVRPISNRRRNNYIYSKPNKRRNNSIYSRANRNRLNPRTKDIYKNR